MQKTETKRRRTLVVVLVLVALLLAAGAGYLLFLHDRGSPTPPAEPVRVSIDAAPALPDAAPAPPDAVRPADAVPERAHAKGGSGGRRPARLAVAHAAKVDATPAPLPPDAALPDARRPDAPKPDYGKLPPWPASHKFKPARVMAMHRNRMSKTFVLVELTYTIDGRQVFKRVDNSGGLDRKRDLKVFSGVLRSGQHKLVVRAVYRGGAHGVFSYHKGYRYRSTAQYTFTANPARYNRITVKAQERGGANTPLVKKPTFKFSHRMTAD